MARPVGSKNKTTTQPTTEINNYDEMDPAEAIAAKENELAALKKRVKYNFQKQAEKLHSVWKLLPAIFKKNISYNTSPEWVDGVPHVHFFHSIDSSGNAQNTCVPIAGHFHEMILVEPATETEPPIYKCSPPLKKVRQRNSAGQWEVVHVPFSPVDHHTHEVEYQGSEVWSPTPIHPDFSKLQQQLAAKIVRSDQFVEQ